MTQIDVQNQPYPRVGESWQSSSDHGQEGLDFVAKIASCLLETWLAGKSHGKSNMKHEYLHHRNQTWLAGKWTIEIGDFPS